MGILVIYEVCSSSISVSPYIVEMPHIFFSRFPRKGEESDTKPGEELNADVRDRNLKRADRYRAGKPKPTNNHTHQCAMQGKLHDLFASSLPEHMVVALVDMLKQRCTGK